MPKYVTIDAVIKQEILCIVSDKKLLFYTYIYDNNNDIITHKYMHRNNYY